MYYVIVNDRDYVDSAWPTRETAQAWLDETADTAKTFDREHPEGYPTPRRIEEREGDPIICKTCNRQVVTSGNPERYPYCKGCHYVGSAAEDLRSESLYFFNAALAGAGFEAQIDHTGGGCFWMSLRKPGSDIFYVATDGEACLPQDEKGDPIRNGWGYVGWHTEDEMSEGYEGVALEFVEAALDDPALGLTDQQVVDRILQDLSDRERGAQ